MDLLILTIEPVCKLRTDGLDRNWFLDYVFHAFAVHEIADLIVPRPMTEFFPKEGYPINEMISYFENHTFTNMVIHF